jgi:hypothetical protein
MAVEPHTGPRASHGGHCRLLAVGAAAVAASAFASCGHGAAWTWTEMGQLVETSRSSRDFFSGWWRFTFHK